jgi:GntR family transcriptional regulator
MAVADDGAILGRLNPGDDRTPFRQVADDLRHAITRGDLAEGDQLPSETELMEHYGIARMTARRALEALQWEGLVRAEHGRGVFVRTLPPVVRLSSQRFTKRQREHGGDIFFAEMIRLGRRPRAEFRRVGEAEPPDWVAERLGLGPDQTVAVRCRTLWADDSPMQLTESYIPMKLARGTELLEADGGDSDAGGAYARIEEAGHILARCQEELTARMPTPEERSLLMLDPGVPVVQVVRTVYDTEGMPVEVYDSVCAADKYTFIYEVAMD